MSNWSIAQSYPYVYLLIVETLLLTPYVQIESHRLYSSNNRQKKNALVVSILFVASYVIYIVFCVGKEIGLGIGAQDSYAYYRNFLNADIPYFEFLHRSNFEWGYLSIVWLFRQLSDNYQVLLFFWYTINYLSFVKYLCYTDQGRLTSVRVLGLMLILLNQLNTLRMTIATAIILLTYLCIWNKKKVQCVILAIIAVSMHVSSLIILPVLAIEYIISNNISKPIMKCALLIVIFIISSVLLSTNMEGIVRNTTRQIYLGQSSLSIGTYIAAGTALLGSLIRYERLININSINRTLIIALPCIFICAPLQLRVAIMYRMVLYFLPLIIVLLTGIYNTFDRRPSLSRMIWLFISVGYVIIQTYQFINTVTSYFGTYTNMYFSS